MPVTSIKSEFPQIITASETVKPFLARLLPDIEEDYRWSIAVEIFLWNYCCEHISSQSLCFSFKQAYDIEMDKQEIPEMLGRINALSRTYPRDVRDFKDWAFEWHKYWPPINSKFKDVYEHWSQLQDQMEEERRSGNTNSGSRQPRYTTSGPTEYYDTYEIRPSRESTRREETYYRDESRRSPEYRPQGMDRRPSYNVVTREPGMSSRSTGPRYTRPQGRRPRDHSPSYSDNDKPRPRVVVVEPRDRR